MSGEPGMEAGWRAALGRQFGAAIEMLENALLACPDDLWDDPAQQPGFWYVAYHTLFWLDLYLSDSLAGFAPPEPFTLDELDPAGLIPERPYPKATLHAYLEHGRRKCRARLEALTEAAARRPCGFEWLDLSVAELQLYSLRHVQHHAAQLNLMLRQRTGAAPRWVKRAALREEDA